MQEIIKNSTHNLVKLSANDDVILDIKYATDDNFTGKAVYDNADCYLHQDAVDKLQNTIILARNIGLRIRIFDAYRPHKVQVELWNHTPDENFLSHPETGSLPHCRGVAVDLTLVDKDGCDLDMGTGFDEFTPLSHHSCVEISPQAQQNRFLLLGIMTAAGWDNYVNEWWHYQLFDARKYPVI